MDSWTLMFLVSGLAWLALAFGSLRSHRLSFERKAWMAVTWAIVIAALAYALDRFA